MISPSHHHQILTTIHLLFDNDASQGSLKATRPPVAGSLFLDPGVNIRSIPLPPRTLKLSCPHHRYSRLATILVLVVVRPIYRDITLESRHSLPRLTTNMSSSASGDAGGGRSMESRVRRSKQRESFTSCAVDETLLGHVHSRPYVFLYVYKT